MLQILYFMLEGNNQNALIFIQMKELIESEWFEKNFLWIKYLYKQIKENKFFNWNFFSDNSVLKHAIKNESKSKTSCKKYFIPESGYILFFIVDHMREFKIDFSLNSEFIISEFYKGSKLKKWWNKKLFCIFNFFCFKIDIENWKTIRSSNEESINDQVNLTFKIHETENYK